MELDFLVIVPILALLALSVVRFGSRPPRVAFALGVAGVLFCGFIGLRASISDEWLWPNSEVDRRTRWLQKHLLRTEGWETRPVLILLGSSATYYGVDAEFLEKELARLGTPATVLSFGMPGATHQERFYMLEAFLRKLGLENREKLASTRVVLLGEVFDAYDRNPLYRLEKEEATERAILFLNPGNALKAWSAYVRALGEHQGTLSEHRAAYLLIEHALLNRFAVGTFSKMSWPNRSPRSTPPFFSLAGRKAGFKFEVAVAEMTKERTRPRSPERVPFPQWLVGQEDLRLLMKPYVDTYGYYCLPLLEVPRSDYQAEFLRQLPPEMVKVSGPTESEMSIFLQPSLWFDGVHPTGEGAHGVTGWMAARLHPQLVETSQPQKIKSLPKSVIGSSDD